MPLGKRPDASPPVLHDLESEVMEEIWARGSASVRQVMEALNQSAARSRAYTTYMTVMARLHGKGVLQRRREGKTDIYMPALSRERYRQLRAQAEVDALVEMFGDVALVHFAQRMEQLDPARLRELRVLAREVKDDQVRPA